MTITATIYKRARSPYYMADFTVRGQRVQKSTKTDDEDEAREIAERWKRQAMEQVWHGKRPPMTVGEAVVRYFRERVEPKAANNLPTTTKNTRYLLSAIVRHFGERTRLEEIAARQIADWKAAMLKDGNKPNTIDRHLTVLISILSMAKDEWGVIATVPVAKKHHVKDGRDRTLSDDEEARLLPACGDDLRDLIVFVLDTGARRADALQLEWTARDVDLVAGRVSFWRTKTDRPRSVPMTQRVKAMLERRKKQASDRRVFPWDHAKLTMAGGRKGSRGRGRAVVTPPDRDPPGVRQYKGCKGWSADIRVNGKKLFLGTFPTHDEAIAARRQAEVQHFLPHDTAGVDQQWSRALTLANISDLRLHDLRHTFASRLVNAGRPLYEVAELLGHTGTRMTSRYAHLDPSRLVASIAALDARAAQPAPAAKPATTVARQ